MSNNSKQVMDISGKVAIVTGGAGGIGKAMVEILLQKQAKVVYFVDINEKESMKVEEELQKKYGDGRVRFYQCDVSVYEQMEACFKEVKAAHGELHIVCNNAGIFNEIKWQRMLEINLNGVVNGTKLAVDYMDGESAGGGVIVNTASKAALVLVPCCPMYATSKYAIIGFTRQTAMFDPVVQRKKIRVNAVCPPLVETNMAYPGEKGRMVEERYQEIINEFFARTTALLSPDDLVKQFVKLIEEPHNGEVMSVTNNGQHYEFIPDQTKTFREEKGIEDEFAKVVKTAANLPHK